VLLALAEDHKPAGVELILVEQSAPAVGPTPLRLVRLDTLPSLPPSTVEKDPDYLISGERLPQIVEQGRLVSRHD